MLIFNENERYIVAKFEDFGVDLASPKPIIAYLIGKVNINTTKIYTLEFTPFKQQLCKFSKDSEGYDKKTNLTKVRLWLNSMMFDNYKYLVYSAVEIDNAINNIVRNCEKTSYPIGNPYTLPNIVRIVGNSSDKAYLDIKDYTDLIIPISECFRQLRINQNYVENVNIKNKLVSLSKRFNFKKNLRVDSAESIEIKSDVKAIPKQIAAYQFTAGEWINGQTRYAGAGFYEVIVNANDQAEVVWETQEYEGVLDDKTELILVGLNDNFEYDPSKLEIVEVTNLAKNKLDEIEHDYTIEIPIKLDSSMAVNPHNIFECLGELINVITINGMINLKLTAFVYDFEKKRFTLTFGTKRIGINKLIKEMIR